MIGKGFKSLKSPKALQRQFSRNVTKDLGGMVFDDVIQAMLKDDILKKLRFDYFKVRFIFELGKLCLFTKRGLFSHLDSLTIGAIFLLYA